LPIPQDPRNLASLQKGREPFKGPGSRAKNEELQATTGEVNVEIRKVRESTQSCWRATKTWREAGEESYKFVENDQWAEEDRNYLQSQRRPVMTFNEVLPQVRLLTGIERQNREELRVFPREGGDTSDAEIMTGLVKYVLDENLAPWQLTRKSNDVYICGRGFVKTDISYDENVTGDVTLKRRNPFGIFWDPLSDDWDGSDMRWIQDAPWLTEEEAKELWPEFEDLIKVGDWLSGETSGIVTGIQSGDKNWNDKLFLDQETRRVRVLEHWYKQRQKVNVAVNPSTGDVKNADDPEFLMTLGIDPANPDPAMAAMAAQSRGFQVIQRNMTMVRVKTVMHWMLLQDKASPFNHNSLPIIPYVGLQFMNEPYGLVEYLKDPQRLKNKSLSNLLNHLNRSANSGWLNAKGRGADLETLKAFGSAAGVVIEYDEVEPQRIEPARLDTGHFSLFQSSDEIIAKISLLNAEIQGTTTQQTTSGKAIEARQKGGMIGNEDFFDNMLLGDKLLGYQLISNIQQVFTGERVMRVMGRQQARSPQEQAAKMFAELQKAPDRLAQTIDRVLKAEYDYVIDRSPANITIRQEQFKMLMEAAQQFPDSIPPDVLVEASDLSVNFKTRIKEHIAMMQQQMMQLEQAKMATQAVGAMAKARNGAPPQ
jgi:hypothetical protein